MVVQNVRLAGPETPMSAIDMLQRCRRGQQAMDDKGDEPDRSPVIPQPFVDDHGAMPVFLPLDTELILEGP